MASLVAPASLPHPASNIVGEGRNHARSAAFAICWLCGPRLTVALGQIRGRKMPPGTPALRMIYGRVIFSGLTRASNSSEVR